MNQGSIIEVDYLRCLRSLLKNLTGIIVFALLCGTLGGFATFTIMDRNDQLENEYEAVSSVYSKAVNVYGQASDVVQYSDVAKSIKVAERAALLLKDSKLDKYTINKMLSVTYEERPLYASSSVVIYFHTQSKDPTDAVRVANAVADAFITEVSVDIQSTDINMLDKAAVAHVVYTPEKKVVLYAGMAATAGLLLACAFLVLREIFSLRLFAVADASLFGQLDIIGVIPRHD